MGSCTGSCCDGFKGWNLPWSNGVVGIAGIAIIFELPKISGSLAALNLFDQEWLQLLNITLWIWKLVDHHFILWPKHQQTCNTLDWRTWQALIWPKRPAPSWNRKNDKKHQHQTTSQLLNFSTGAKWRNQLDDQKIGPKGLERLNLDSPKVEMLQNQMLALAPFLGCGADPFVCDAVENWLCSTKCHS